MKTLKVLYIHGIDLGPRGSCVTALRSRYDVVAPKMDTSSAKAWAESPVGFPDGVVAPYVAQMTEALRKAKPDVVVGAGFGGAVALTMAWVGSWDGPLVLLAPSIRKFTTFRRAPSMGAKHMTIVHGTGDTTVPYLDSVDFFTASDSKPVLKLVSDDHKLAKTSGVLPEVVMDCYRGKR